MSHTWGRRLLQVFVALSALNAIVGGGLYLISGVKGMALTGSKVSLEPGTLVAVDYLFRAIAGIWFTLGLMFAYLVPMIEKHTVWFRFTCLAIFMMGVGRLLSVTMLGAGTNPLFAMILELVFPPLLIWWQARVAREV